MASLALFVGPPVLADAAAPRFELQASMQARSAGQVGGGLHAGAAGSARVDHQRADLLAGLLVVHPHEGDLELLAVVGGVPVGGYLDGAALVVEAGGELAGDVLGLVAAVAPGHLAGCRAARGRR